MKKILCVIVAMALMATLSIGLAEEAISGVAAPTGIAISGTPAAIESGDTVTYTYYGDTQSVKVDYELINTEDYTGKYSITVGDAKVSVDEGVDTLIDKLYVAQLDASGTLYLLVGDFGPSDDPVSYVYAYVNGKLYNCGYIPAMPYDIDYSNYSINTRIRARVIETWVRPATFVVARTTPTDVDAEPVFTIAEVPQYTYPMGRIATLNKPLKLRVSPTDSDVALELPEGEQVVLVSTDDATYVYIQPLDMAKYEYKSGYALFTGENSNMIDTGDGEMYSWDLFSGLLLAD